mgnify:CR=1 FL=1
MRFILFGKSERSEIEKTEDELRGLHARYAAIAEHNSIWTILHDSDCPMLAEWKWKFEREERNLESGERLLESLNKTKQILAK